MHYSLRFGSTRKWQAVPILSAAVGLASVVVFMTALVRGVGIGTVLFETGWVLAVGVVAALGIYRFLLSHYDHRFQQSGVQGLDLLHGWFMHREALVDHVAIPLTIGALLYTVVFGMFIASQILDAIIRAIVSAFTLY